MDSMGYPVSYCIALNNQRPVVLDFIVVISLYILKYSYNGACFPVSLMVGCT